MSKESCVVFEEETTTPWYMAVLDNNLNKMVFMTTDYEEAKRGIEEVANEDGINPERISLYMSVYVLANTPWVKVSDDINYQTLIHGLLPQGTHITVM